MRAQTSRNHELQQTRPSRCGCKRGRSKGRAAEGVSFVGMNPFGLFSVLSGTIDASGHAFGRKPRTEARRERAWFTVLYLVLLVLGIAAIILAVRHLYFEK